MSWWQARRTRKRLERMGIDVDAASQMAAAGLEEAENVRAELAARESPAYVRLVEEINALTCDPVPAQQRYEQSVALIHQADMSDWERNDLLAQTERIYGEVLETRPYIQVLWSLQQIQASDLARTEKATISLQLLESYDLPEDEKRDVTEQVQRVYKVVARR
jgi:hypothetical protein